MPGHDNGWTTQDSDSEVTRNMVRVARSGCTEAIQINSLVANADPNSQYHPKHNNRPPDEELERKAGSFHMFALWLGFTGLAQLSSESVHIKISPLLAISTGLLAL